MLLTEAKLENAIRTLFSEMKLPRPSNYSLKEDAKIMKNIVVPAFLKALEKIESIDFCDGFKEEKIFSSPDKYIQEKYD